MLYRSPAPLPQKFENFSIFIGGGISNCPDWQSEIVGLIDTEGFDVVNPRRDGDLARTGGEAERQIAWEFRALHAVDAVLFWFPKESICPITLFEYGGMLQRCVVNKCAVYVGWDPEYPRAFDLDVQTNLVMDRHPKIEARLDFAKGYEEFKEMIRLTFGTEVGDAD